MKQGCLVSVIISNFNGRKELEELLPSVFNTKLGGRYEVLLVDGNSTDGSLEYVREHYPQVNIIIDETNQGHSAGINMGLEASQGRYIALLDNDVVVEPGWLENSLKTFQRHPRTAAVQCKLISYFDHTKIDSAGGVMDQYGWFSERGRLYGSPEEDRGQYDKEEPIFSGCSAALIVDKKALEEIDGFDEKFFICYNDADACWRLRLQGYEILFAPDAIVYHKRQETFNKRLPKEGLVMHRAKNLIMMIMKNFELKKLLFALPLGVVSELGLATTWLLTGNLKPAGAVIKGLWWNLRHFPYILRSRRIIQKRRQVSDVLLSPLMLKGSLLFSQKNLSRFLIR